jgi:hypothetical protein
MKKARRRRLGEVRVSAWSAFGLGVASSIVGSLIVYLLLKDHRFT